MGGTVSSTSKVAVIAKSQRPGVDVDYHFFQVDIVIPRVDDSANCGNISSAVGPYAIDEGLVPAVEPITVVRVYNENTKKVIEEHVRVQNGHACVNGDTVIQGVPGTGSRVDLFLKILPAPKPANCSLQGRKRKAGRTWLRFCEVTLIDCSNR